MREPSQRLGSPEEFTEMNRNEGLNKGENPSQPLVECGQILIGSSAEKCKEAAVEMAVAAHDAARKGGFSFSTVGTVSSRGAVAVTRAFDKEDPPSTFVCLAGLLMLDTSNEWLRRAARLKGCALVEKPRLTKEQKYDRLVETLRRHGRLGEALLSESEDGP